jgi:hypothetical protein
MRKIKTVVAFSLLTSASFAGHIRFMPSSDVTDISFRYFEAISPVPNSHCVPGSLNLWYDYQHVDDTSFICKTRSSAPQRFQIAHVNQYFQLFEVSMFDQFDVTEINGKPAPGNCFNLARIYNFKADENHAFAVSPGGGCSHKT